MLTELEINTIIKKLASLEEGISDVFILSGYPLQIIVHGKIKTVYLEELPVETLTPFQTELIAFHLMNYNPSLYVKLLRDGYVDLSYSTDDETRFRVNIFSKQRTYNIIMRKLEAKVKG